MKKEYKTPSIGIQQMIAFRPLAVTQSIEGDWGPGGGEAGAKGSLFDATEEEMLDDDDADNWDPEGNPYKLKKQQRKWYQAID